MLKVPNTPQLVACAFALAASPELAAAQDIVGRTAVYSWLGTSNQVFVAPSGNVYWSIQSTVNGKFTGAGKGAEYKLGRAKKTTKGGCTSTTIASKSGNRLVLDINSVCANIQSTTHNVITFYGDSCEMTGSGTSHTADGDTSYSESASSCQVVDGVKLAQ